MANAFNYNVLLNQAADHIRHIRNPQAVRREYIELNKAEIDENVLVSIGGFQYDQYSTVITAARNITISCLNAIVVGLFKRYNVNAEIITLDGNISKSLNIHFVFNLVDQKKLLLFKNPEKDFIWKSPGHEPNEIASLMDRVSAMSCEYIYLLYDNAHLQIIGNGDNNVTNARSFKWLFETYFSEDEFISFQTHFSNYISYINSFLGYSITKHLTPSARVNFRQLTINKISNYPYAKITGISANGKQLLDSEFRNIQKQFIDLNLRFAMIGCCDFAESFITAEWLYESMKSAQAVDLTMIGMGYLKATEQLLYQIMLLHKNEGRQIKKLSSTEFDDLPSYIEFNDHYINLGATDTSIGSMAVFYKKNPDMLRRDISFSAKKYIIESIFVYKDIRNGYFHKHNIHEWVTIDKIREASLNLAFLILGSAIITDGDRTTIGIPSDDFSSDRYKLCEYVNYHVGDVFFLCYGDQQEAIVQAVRDPYAKPVNGIVFQYTGAYFTQNGSRPKNVFEEMPQKIYLGSLGIKNTATIQLNPHKVTLIYDDGKFVGPAIYSETGNHF